MTYSVAVQGAESQADLLTKTPIHSGSPELAADLDLAIAHFSTQLFLDGENGHAPVESDRLNPLSFSPVSTLTARTIANLVPSSRNPDLSSGIQTSGDSLFAISADSPSQAVVTDSVSRTLRPQGISGFWGQLYSNTYEYDQSGTPAQIIITDDGVSRIAYPYSLTQQRPIYDRPQYEWETPTRVEVGHLFTPDGRFEIYGKTEAGTMPTGYIKLETYAIGSYTIEGEYLALDFDYVLGVVYNDLDNYYNSRLEPPAYTHIKVTFGDANSPPTIAFFVKQADGRMVPWSESPTPSEMQWQPIDDPTNPAKGISLEGTLRGDEMNGTPQNDIFNGKAGNDVLTGAGGADRLIGFTGNDSLVGGIGSDFLNGGEGQDNLNGGSGNDKMQGGSGNDTLFGSTGNNLLEGGSGNDMFVLTKGRGANRITDFRDRQDKLGLSGGVSLGSLNFKQQGDDVLIRSGRDVLAIVEDTRLNQITARDFVVV